ncbi:MAG: hypothetical protein JXQ87_04315 [Bacteroidia bacterium]
MRLFLFLIIFPISLSYIEPSGNVFFSLKANGENIKGGDTIDINLKKYVLEKVKFYVADFKVYKNQEIVLDFDNSSFLFDFSNTSQENIQFPSSLKFDSVSFTLGIDSATNCSGAYGGDLDPTKGMYWSWQSGYINFKLEAKSVENHSDLIYHLGGYKKGELCTQQVGFKMKGCSDHEIELNVDEVLDHFLNQGIEKLMSPGTEAKKLSKLVANSFVPKCLEE